MPIQHILILSTFFCSLLLHIRLTLMNICNPTFLISHTAAPVPDSAIQSQDSHDTDYSDDDRIEDDVRKRFILLLILDRR
jgi:hypothetical protein